MAEQFITHSPEETSALAQRLAQDGTVVDTSEGGEDLMRQMF